MESVKTDTTQQKPLHFLETGQARLFESTFLPKTTSNAR